MKSAYLQCVGGASGDMILGAVIDAGVSLDVLNDAIKALGVKGVKISEQSGQRGGVNGTQAFVEVSKRARHPHHLEEFIDLTQESTLPTWVIERSCAIFRRIGKAEAAVHRSSNNGVHLGELGDLDTLVDVVCSVVGLDALGIDRLYSSPFPSGSGVVKTEHGMLPVPAPATSALFAMARAPVVSPPGNVPDAGEMVTPTGAAIITTLATFSQPALNLEASAYGLGSRESLHYPNVLALWIGEENGTSYVTDLTLLETNIDDTTAEILAYAQEQLFEIGARDVWFTPIQMKKSRPATMLSALVPSDIENQAARLIMRETSSLGVRVRPAARYEAEREIVKIKTSVGQASVKVKKLDGVNVAVSPEYDDCRQIAMKKGLALQDVYRIVQQEAADQLLTG